MQDKIQCLKELKDADNALMITELEVVALTTIYDIESYIRSIRSVLEPLTESNGDLALIDAGALLGGVEEKLVKLKTIIDGVSLRLSEEQNGEGL